MDCEGASSRGGNHFFLAPPGQQIGHGPEPRYLCPRLQVFQPLLVCVPVAFFFVAMIGPSAIQDLVGADRLLLPLLPRNA